MTKQYARLKEIQQDNPTWEVWSIAAILGDERALTLLEKAVKDDKTPKIKNSDKGINDGQTVELV